MGIVVPWLNWIERPPPKGQVTGSSPVGIANLKLPRIRKILIKILIWKNSDENFIKYYF